MSQHEQAGPPKGSPSICFLGPQVPRFRCLSGGRENPESCFVCRPFGMAAISGNLGSYGPEKRKWSLGDPLYSRFVLRLTNAHMNDYFRIFAICCLLLLISSRKSFCFVLGMSAVCMLRIRQGHGEGGSCDPIHPLRPSVLADIPPYASSPLSGRALGGR